MSSLYLPTIFLLSEAMIVMRMRMRRMGVMMMRRRRRGVRKMVVVVVER